MGEPLLDWADKQVDWVRDALRRHAVSPSFELSPADKKAVLERVQHAAGIALAEAPTHAPLAKDHLNFGEAKGKRSVLNSLGPVANLGRLAPGQKLSFALNGVTLIYGENGSGKSGYCRITKKICRSLTADDLLGNVFEPGQKPPAEVMIRYQPDGAAAVTEEKWVDGTPPPAQIANISVFDSRNARLFVDQNNEIGFLPAAISLLERHAACRSEMDSAFDAERKALDKQIKTPLPTGFMPDGKAAAAIAKLVPKEKDLPTEASLNALGDWTDEKQTELKLLETELAQDPALLAARASRAEAILKSYAETVASIEAGLGEAAAASIASKAQAVSAAVTAAALAASQAFAEEPLAEVGQDPWRRMYDFATAYVASIGQGDDLPSAEGDPCALCQQPLSAEASDRMGRFRDFVAGEAAKSAEAARTLLTDAAALVEELAIPTKNAVDQAFAEYRTMGQDRADLAGKIADYLETARSRKTAVLEASNKNTFDAVPALATTPKPMLDKDIEGLAAEAATFKQQAEQDSQSPEKAARVSELKDCERFKNSLPIILARRNDLARHAKLGDCCKLVNNAQLSSAITTIRRSLVTEGLETRIQNEITALDLGHIPFAVADRSKDGHSFFSVNLKAPISVANDKVLSEGEQRALGLACFLAEVDADTARNGLVIDDPVSSLDHLRIRRVARRLVEEAGKGRQVIIFTHNLLFYNEVAEAAAAANPPVPLARRVITKSHADGFGIISESAEPWTAQKVGARVNVLRERRKQIEAAHKDFNTDAYRSVAKDFYTDLRETWERLVEELLLGQVAERFTSEVQTLRLKGVTVEDEDYRTVYFAMKRVSERSGHDIAAAKQIPIPTPADMTVDLDAIDSYRQALVKRRKTLEEQRKVLEQAPAAAVG
jgi:energy-coupling factor transporter ATP-binding protein EcfA2